MRTLMDRFIEWLFSPGELLPRSRSAALREILRKAEMEQHRGN